MNLCVDVNVWINARGPQGWKASATVTNAMEVHDSEALSLNTVSD